MKEKINLNFKISAINNKIGHYKESIIKKEYDSDLIFKDVLVDIYNEYSIDELEKKETGPNNYCIFINEPNLFDINYKFIDLQLEPSMLNYDYIKLKDLERQFGISKKLFELLLDPGIGGEVGRCIGIHFFFHTKEKVIHHNPHIHCKCGSEELRVDLNKLTIMDKPFKNKRQNELIIRVIKKNQNELIKYWNNVVINGESVKFRMYIPKNYK